MIDLKSELVASTPPAYGVSKRRQWLIGLFVVFLFFIFVSYYLSAHWGEFCYLWEFSYRETLMAGVLLFLGFLLTCYQMNLFLKKFGVRAGFFELIFVTHGMMLGNLVIPMRGGSGGLAVYLKKKHRLNYHKFGVIFGGTAILVGLVSATMSLGALFFLAIAHSIFELSLTAISLVLLAGCLYLTFFPPRFKRYGSGRMMAFASRLNESWVSISKDVALLTRVTISLLFINLFQTSALYLLYIAVGSPLSFLGTLITSSLGAVANLVPITPGSLGIFDAVAIQAPRLLGLDTTAAIMATVLLRILCFVICFVVGMPGLYYFYRAARSENP
ncbi:MAG: lysylphosphatidylglycerol synthase transmembrane domain-containing protein [Deltaproteobacteria bacterium]|nr:lysylphosphatidylglycerol synthase transmembrane domain-containing protein [Deltaproteobacteria bacterium]